MDTPDTLTPQPPRGSRGRWVFTGGLLLLVVIVVIMTSLSRRSTTHTTPVPKKPAMTTEQAKLQERLAQFSILQNPDAHEMQFLLILDLVATSWDDLAISEDQYKRMKKDKEVSEIMWNMLDYRREYSSVPDAFNSAFGKFWSKERADKYFNVANELSETFKLSYNIAEDRWSLESKHIYPTNSYLASVTDSVLGSVNRDGVKRVVKALYDSKDSTIHIVFAADDNLTNKDIRAGIAMDSLRLLKRLDADINLLYIDRIFISSTFPISDKYGNTTEKVVAKYEISNSTLQKVNWDNFTYDMLYAAADAKWLSPSLQE